jgi:predicted permease
MASTIDTGFEATDRYAVGVDLSLEGFGDDAAGLMQLERMLERIRAIPGTRSATLASDLPLDLGMRSQNFEPEGYEDPRGVGGMQAEVSHVADAFFSTMGIRLVEGRGFTQGDVADAEEVVVVNTAFARAAWPEGAALGRRVGVGGERVATVVGVAVDVKSNGITDAPQPIVYLPIRQNYVPAVQFVVHAGGGFEAEAPALRAALLEVDPRLSMEAVVSVERFTQLGLMPQKIAGFVATTLGGLALFLSAIGIYGVVAYGVRRKRREIGVRIALGAERSRVAALVLRDGVLLALPGLVIGALAALVVGKLIRSLLLGMSGIDPVGLALVGAVFLAVVALASWAPARRAASVPPTESLRADA